MKFIIKREKLLHVLQKICSIIPTRPSIPILSHILLKVNKNNLICIATNLEIEITANIILHEEHILGEVTIPGRKIFDIFRHLPNDATVLINEKENKVVLRSNNSSFSLSTLPVQNFPNVKRWIHEIEFTIQQNVLKHLIETTYFSMANQDVRYYLNGMLFKIKKNTICVVTSDGHRLSLCSIFTDVTLPEYSVIIPRKSILELTRLLKDNILLLNVQMNKNNIRIFIENFIFTSKLIEGKFPDYQYILLNNFDRKFKISCSLLKTALIRAAILSNEKLRGIRFIVSKNILKIISNNIEQEAAEEILSIDYDDVTLEICFNVVYILDVLNVLKSEYVYFILKDGLSSIKIENKDDIYKSLYIIMPMRL